MGLIGEPENLLLSGMWSSRSEKYNEYKKILNIHVANYHWSDSNKFKEDYKYLRELSKKILKLLSSELNKIHGCNQSLDYWRILLMPWLNAFVPSVFDRWESVADCIDNYNIESISVIEFSLKETVPNCTFDFNINYNLEDFWNEYIFSRISTYQAREKDISLIKGDEDKKIIKPYPSYNKESKNKFIQNIFDIFSKFKSKNTIFFHDISIDKFDKLKLEAYLKLLPSNYKSKKFNNFEFKKEIREDINISKEAKSEFERFIFDMIPYQIPKVFIEGFIESKNGNYNNWPKRPKLICSSGSFYADDFFKFYLAKHLSEKTSKLHILQHGGHYGIGKISGMLDYELEIADKYISWGWNINSKKILELPSIKLSNIAKKKDYSRNGNLLIVAQDTPRYSYHLFSYPMSSEYLNYENDIKIFYKNLRKEIQTNSLLRFKHGGRYGWNQQEEFSNEFPGIHLDNPSKPLAVSVSNARICIQTSNFTTYLETLAQNIPTIIFWDSKNYELTDDARTYFDELQKVKIFFDNPKDASDYVNQIWENIDLWWQDKRLQAARKNFINKYALTSRDSVRRLADEIKTSI